MRVNFERFHTACCDGRFHINVILNIAEEVAELRRVARANILRSDFEHLSF